MRYHEPRIVIIGAGIIGSAITYNLARRGADVILVDEGRVPGCGVTGKAFGWVNIINGTPGEKSYDLWRDAIAEYSHLRAALPSVFSHARTGSLLWKATATETKEFAERHQAASENIELLPESTVRDLEPRLRHPPDLAVFSPDDLALDPAHLATDLVSAAVAAGALTRFGGSISAVETRNGRIVAIRTENEVIAADVVVLAAGTGVSALAKPLGIDIGLTSSPALLLRYNCSRPVINHILKGPRLEIRQAPDHTLLVAKSFVDDGSPDGPQRIGQRLLTVMQDELDLPDDVVLKDAQVGYRPIFDNGLPRFGFSSEIEGLYVAVGHPGVILAPLIGRLTAEDILGAAVR